MERLLVKRNEYVSELSNINDLIDKEVNEFFTAKVEELKLEANAYRNEVAKKYESDIDVINEKIKVIDEIISEEMPEAIKVQELINDDADVIIETKPIVEKQVEEKAEEAQTEVVDNDVLDQIQDEVVEDVSTIETKEDIEENIVEENIVEDVITEDQKVDEIETIDLDQIIMENNLIDEELTESEQIDKVKEEIKEIEEIPSGVCGDDNAENRVCAACEDGNLVNQTSKSVEETLKTETISRPGMPQILNPR